MRVIRHHAKFDAVQTVRHVFGEKAQTAVNILNMTNAERFNDRSLRFHPPYDNDFVFGNQNARYTFRLIFIIENDVLQSFSYTTWDTWAVKNYSLNNIVISTDSRQAVDIQDTRKLYNNLLDRAKAVVSSLIAYDKENVPVQQFGIDVTPILDR